MERHMISDSGFSVLAMELRAVAQQRFKPKSAERRVLEDSAAALDMVAELNFPLPMFIEELQKLNTLLERHTGSG